MATLSTVEGILSYPFQVDCRNSFQKCLARSVFPRSVKGTFLSHENYFLFSDEPVLDLEDATSKNWLSRFPQENS